MTVRLKFSNNALTTLAAPITSTATSATLTAGGGALFPVPGTNEAFKLTFFDAATQLVREIVQVTQMSGDTIVQMARAQEGTAASAYLAGDFAGAFNTAGTQAQFQQQPITAGPVTSAQTITGPGVISYNLTGGSVTQAMPSISSMGAFDGLTVELWKSDASANALIVTSSDGFAGQGSVLTQVAQGQPIILEVSVAQGKWLVQSLGTGITSQSGSFVGTLIGCTTSPTAIFNYCILAMPGGRVCTIALATGVSLTGTSNSTSCSINFTAAAIAPTNATIVPGVCLEDNSVTLRMGAVTVNAGGGNLLLSLLNTSTGALTPTFTGSGTKGLTAGFTMTFMLQ